MGGQPKSPLTASGRGNQPAERLPESNRGCPGLKDSRSRPQIELLPATKRTLVKACT